MAGNNDCKICGLDRDLHTKGPCPFCGDALEHHPDGTEACRSGKARMARARRPEDRNDVDRLALAGEPA